MNGGVAFRPRQPRIHRTMDVNRVFREFADATSMHGVPRIINARSQIARIFWTIICIGAFGMFMWQCAILLERYYSYPKKVNVEIIQQPVQFPWVSVCNTDHLDILTVDRIEALLNEFNATDEDLDENLLAWQKSYSDFWDTSMAFFMSFQPPDESIVQTQEAVYSRLGITANLGVDLASLGGIKRDDFIVSCRFMGESCNISESFVTFFDPYYFNCFTFRPQGDMITRASRLNGAEYGLTMLLFMGSAGQLAATEESRSLGGIMPGMEETDSALTSGRGAKVVVHSPNTAANPSVDSYDAPPGFSVTLGVRASENVRIPAPWGNCTEGDKNSTFLYTLRDCRNDCLQKRIMKVCGCIDNKVTIPPAPRTLPFCLQLPSDFCSFMDIMNMDMQAVPTRSEKECKRIRDEWNSKVMCREEVFLNMSLGIPLPDGEECVCYAPCRDVQYDSSYSLSTLPENTAEHYSFYYLIDNFLQTMAEGKKKVLQAKHEGAFTGNISSYISRITVYIADNNVLKTSESPDYEAIRLISDIGGQLGLWIGISVMTLFEVLQLAADVCRFITAGSGQTLKSAKERRPPRVDRVADTERSDWRYEVDKLTAVWCTPPGGRREIPLSAASSARSSPPGGKRYAPLGTSPDRLHATSVQSLPERERWYAPPGTPPGERWHMPSDHSPTLHWQAGPRTPPSERFPPLLGTSASTNDMAGGGWLKPPGTPPGDRKFAHRRAFNRGPPPKNKYRVTTC